MEARYMYAVCRFCGHEPVRVRSATIAEARKYGHGDEDYYGKCRACGMPDVHDSDDVQIKYD